MDRAHELDESDLAVLKMHLGQLQMVGRFGYSMEDEKFVDIMKGFRIIQNMAEYVVEKIVNLEKTLKNERQEVVDTTSLEYDAVEDIVNLADNDEISNIRSKEITDFKQERLENTSDINESLQNVNKDTKELGEKNILKCNKCFKCFVNLKNFYIHVCQSKKNVKIPCSLCAKVISKANMSHHTKTHSNIIMLTCAESNKSFRNKFAFESHMHAETVNLNCQLCNKSFLKPSLLLKHERMHSNVKRERLPVTVCKFCELECTSITAARKHMKMEHIDQAMHCDICANPFFSKRGLKEHMKEHVIT